MSGSNPTAIRSSLADLLLRPRYLPLLALTASFGALLSIYDLGRRPPVTFLLIALTFVFYFWAARRFESTATPKLILGVAALLRLLLIPIPATLSDDTLRYVWDGKVWSSGMNPYRWAPEAPELAALRDPLWESMPHKEVPTVYPPLALSLFTLASALPHPLLSVKILLTLAEFFGCFLLLRLTSALGMPTGRAVWYCWNPLPVLEVAGMGHVDGLLVAAQIAAVLLLVQRRPLGAGLAAAAGVLAKLVPLVVLPFWTRLSGHPTRFLCAALLAVLAAALPVVIALGGVPPGLVKYGVSWEFNGPLYEPLWRGFDQIGLDDTVKSGLDRLKNLTGQHELLNRVYPFVYPQLLAKGVLLGVFGLLFLFVWRFASSGASIVGVTGRILGAVAISSATFYPWYLLWILPWAALARHRAWLVLSALLQLAYVPQLMNLALFPWIWLLIWGPFFFLLPRSSWSID